MAREQAQDPLHTHKLQAHAHTNAHRCCWLLINLLDVLIKRLPWRLAGSCRLCVGGDLKVDLEGKSLTDF